MRTFWFLLGLLGAIPGATLVLLTFLGFPQWEGVTRKLVGPEPEVVRYYSWSKVIGGKRVSLEVVPRKLPRKFVPACFILIGICTQLAGVIVYFVTKSE